MQNVWLRNNKANYLENQIIGLGLSPAVAICAWAGEVAVESIVGISERTHQNTVQTRPQMKVVLDTNVLFSSLAN
jgi:hypothetical protein